MDERFCIEFPSWLRPIITRKVWRRRCHIPLKVLILKRGSMMWGEFSNWLCTVTISDRKSWLDPENFGRIWECLVTRTPNDCLNRSHPLARSVSAPIAGRTERRAVFASFEVCCGIDALSQFGFCSCRDGWIAKRPSLAPWDIDCYPVDTDCRDITISRLPCYSVWYLSKSLRSLAWVIFFFNIWW